jgi:rod shape-determining protein MreC
MRDTRRTRVILVALLLISLTLLALGTSGPGGTLRKYAGDVFGPVQRAVAAAWRPVHDVFTGNDPSSAQRISDLERQNMQLQLQLNALGYSKAREAELSGLLKVASLGQYRITLADVIATGSAQTFSNTAEIDAGSRDGLKLNMIVITGQGLVGRLVSVSPSVSTVLLATDPNFGVGARFASTLQVGLMRGEGDEPMQVEPFNAQAVMKPGDRVVTYQSGFVPGGIPIGTVTSVNGTIGSSTRYANLQPFVDFSSLDLVGIIVQGPRTDPLTSVLPAKTVPPPVYKACAGPTPTGTASAGTTVGASPNTTPSSSGSGASPGSSPGSTPATGPTASPTPSPCISYPPGYRGPRG